MNHDTFHGSVRSYTTSELVERFYENLHELAPKGSEKAFIAGFISSCLGDIAEKGVDELTFIVDYTNQQVEAKRKMLESITDV
jgi:hypothetical protein